ncbi:MAG: hypothetical protein ACOX4T_10815 [Acetivibrionales bacterium]
MRIMKKLFIIVFLLSIFLSITYTSVYAGNNDSLPSYGYSGKGDDRWKYNIQLFCNEDIILLGSR